MEHEHFKIDERNKERYTFKTKKAGPPTPPPEVDRTAHKARLEHLYSSALSESEHVRSSINEDARATGAYLSLNVRKKTISLERFTTKSGVKLMNAVSLNDDENSLTVFLPDKKHNWLSTRLKQYGEEETKKGEPRNKALVNSISDIRLSEVINLFTIAEDREKFDKIPSDLILEVEVWFDTSDIDTADIEKRLLDNRYITAKPIRFKDTVIYLVKASKESLSKLMLYLDNIRELRIYHDPSPLLAGPAIVDQEWTEYIKSQIEDNDDKVRIGIIDSGVENHHPLLIDYLPDERIHNTSAARSARDARNHGTLLAGLSLFGDLTDVIYSQRPLKVISDLTSVKITPGRHETPNNLAFLGAITEDAISLAAEDGAEIMLSATMTDTPPEKGRPTSLSSAIDEILYSDGKANKLLFMSAGNVDGDFDIEDSPYPEYNKRSEVKDPGQSWNAVTVGAYTEKCILDGEYGTGLYAPVAAKGGLSPWSRTSSEWGDVIKPEIVMEGGNAIIQDSSLSDAPDSLNLVSTDSRFNKLGSVNGTSAATALAARLASEVKYANPYISPLTIRALMIHSAEWTDEMRLEFSDNIELMLHTCGYGVPNAKRAIASSDSYVSFYLESEILPFSSGSGSTTLSGMDVISLPWPQDTLMSMGSEKVRMKVTLSYYVQPSPSSVSVQMKRYPSLKLRFDTNNFTESKEDFVNRVGHTGKGKNDPSRWKIGIRRRDKGCIISDYMETTAANISACRYIAVYPEYGWWRNSAELKDVKVKYSLVVSLQTETTEILTEVINRVENEIKNEIRY